MCTLANEPLVFEVYKKEKYAYKNAVRVAKNCASNVISNDLHDAMSKKDNNKFWRIWRSNFGSDHSSGVKMIDGMVDAHEISEAFAKYFAGVCKPNSDETNSRLRDIFDARFLNYSGDDLKRSDLFTIENICKMICDLKIGKAAGFDNIETEHLLYCHPVVHVYITYLCNLILLTGHVPLEFGRE